MEPIPFGSSTVRVPLVRIADAAVSSVMTVALVLLFCAISVTLLALACNLNGLVLSPIVISVPVELVLVNCTTPDTETVAVEDVLLSSVMVEPFTTSALSDVVVPPAACNITGAAELSDSV